MKTETKTLMHKRKPTWHMIKSILSVIGLATAVSTFAQSGRLETEKGLTEAIAPFDADVRTNFLIASEYPQTITQLKNSQMRTAETFQKMIGRFRQKKQEWFYTITRYPELMHRLATLPPKQTREDVNKLLPHQEPDLQEAAWHLYRNEKKNLAKLDNIRANATAEFDKSISHLPGSAREAFRQLQTKPDVLALLTNNVDLTTRLGEHYKNNPSEVTSQLASLHDKLEIQNQRDAAAFKKQMEEDPKAMKELRHASSAYGTNPYYNNPYYYPYSYWFGYPYWYSYPVWYPGMFWYYPGFYFGVSGLYGFPSYGFSFWFYNGGYYQRYPHLYRQFGAYYQNNITRATRTMVIAPASRDFMNVATSHYRPNASVSATSPFSYNRPANVPRMNTVNMGSRIAPTTFHTQSRSVLGGGLRPMSGGFGGGLHGGGFHGRR